MFRHLIRFEIINCRFKKEQVPQIAAKSKSGNTVTLYRVADHIDISGGPMIANSSLIGLFAVAAVSAISDFFFIYILKVNCRF